VKNWEELLEATKQRDAAYLRILELRKIMKEAEAEHQKCIDKITELHAEGA